MAELVDALASGASGLTAVKVRVLSWAPPAIPGVLLLGAIVEGGASGLSRASSFDVTLRGPFLGATPKINRGNLSESKAK